MRTTVTLAPDVAAAVARFREDRSVGISEAINQLIRAGLGVEREPVAFRQRTFPSGLGMSVTNIADTLEILEGPMAR